MNCPYCDNGLTAREASIPESIICYKAGREDPSISGNRIVTEWVCPVHGAVYSPGGGIAMTVVLQGGPWDGRVLVWDVVNEQVIQTGDKSYLYEKGEILPEYTKDGHRHTHMYKFTCKGEVE